MLPEYITQPWWLHRGDLAGSHEARRKIDIQCCEVLRVLCRVGSFHSCADEHLLHAETRHSHFRRRCTNVAYLQISKVHATYQARAGHTQEKGPLEAQGGP